MATLTLVILPLLAVNVLALEAEKCEDMNNSTIAFHCFDGVHCLNTTKTICQRERPSLCPDKSDQQSLFCERYRRSPWLESHIQGFDVDWSEADVSSPLKGFGKSLHAT